MPGLLALLAHPDDEFFCAGLLAALAENKVPVHLAYWTRGEGGGSPRFRQFWRLFPRDWRPRVREAKRSAALLHAASLDFLGAIDPVADGGFRAPADASPVVVEQISRLVARHAPEIVITHGAAGEYGHPAHQRLNEIAREFAAVHPGLPLLSFAAALPSGPAFLNAGDTADFIFDSLPHMEKKRGMVLAYRSQRGVFESLPGAGGSLETLLTVTRLEGYRAWIGKDRALDLLRGWTGLLPSQT